MRATDKFCYFMEQSDGAFDAKDDFHCPPLSLFKGFHIEDAAPATLVMAFGHNKLTPGIRGEGFDDIASSGGRTDVDEMTLTITSSKQKEVIQDIMALMNANYEDGMLVIADVANSKFASPHITGVTINMSA